MLSHPASWFDVRGHPIDVVGERALLVWLSNLEHGSVRDPSKPQTTIKSPKITRMAKTKIPYGNVASF